MNRKIKALGLALVAALALTAVMASTVSANFTSTTEHTVLSGNQVESHRFTAGVGVGAISCATITFSGTVVGTSQATWVLTPIYAGCKDSLGRTVHVAVAAKYELTSTAGKGLVHITGGNIVVTVTGASNCVITITPQNSKNNVTYTQEGNNLKLTTTTNNIHSHISGGFFACGTSSTTSTTGTLSGTTLMQGNGGATKISVH
jgi:hypothetical protein